LALYFIHQHDSTNIKLFLLASLVSCSVAILLNFEFGLFVYIVFFVYLLIIKNRHLKWYEYIFIFAIFISSFYLAKPQQVYGKIYYLLGFNTPLFNFKYLIIIGAFSLFNLLVIKYFKRNYSASIFVLFLFVQLLFCYFIFYPRFHHLLPFFSFLLIYLSYIFNTVFFISRNFFKQIANFFYLLLIISFFIFIFKAYFYTDSYNNKYIYEWEFDYFSINTSMDKDFFQNKISDIKKVQELNNFKDLYLLSENEYLLRMLLQKKNNFLSDDTRLNIIIEKDIENFTNHIKQKLPKIIIYDTQLNYYIYNDFVEYNNAHHYKIKSLLNLFNLKNNIVETGLYEDVLYNKSISYLKRKD
jgi:hypothetical protein